MADYDSRKRKPPEYPRKGTIHMKKWTNTNPMRRLLSLALSVVMVLSVLPAGALAEEGENTPPSCTCEVACAETVNESCQVCSTEVGQCTAAQQQEPVQKESEQEQKTETCTHGNDPEGCEACASAKKVAQVQAQIDALPEEVTAESKEAAQSALSAVDEAKSALTESEQAQLDMTRYTALAEKLAALESPAPSATEETTEKTDKVLTDWEWDDGFEIVDEESGYLILPFTAEAFTANFEQVKGMLPEAILVGEEALTLGNWTYETGEEGAVVTIDSESCPSPGSFKTTLPEGYVLDDGTNVLSLTVVLGDPEGEQAGQLTITPKAPTTGTYTIDGASVTAYQLSSAEHLYWFAQKVNGGENTINAVLTDDITVNSGVLNTDGSLNSAKIGSFEVWTPIGTASKPYSGKFDGQNHTISGLYVNDATASYIGLFGMLGNPSFVTRVTVADSYFSGSHYIGGICGSAYTYPISYCKNYATVCGSGANNSGAAYVGGICGEDGQLSHCENHGLVTGSGKRVGGICGSSATVSDCKNFGAVQGDVDYVGGIVGYSTKSISNSENHGAVQGKAEYVGGIAGYSTGSDTSVKNCSNFSRVQGDKAMVGGIVGQNSATVEKCTNKSSAPVTGGDQFTGGICGDNMGGTVTGCQNEATVTGHIIVGGIVGYNYTNAQVSDCTNTGSVTGSSTFIGGIVGDLETGTVTGCDSSGIIKGTSSVGGIVGRINDSGTIQTCKNSGTVTGCNSDGTTTDSNIEVGGICGDNMGGTVRNCENNGGAVSGDSNVGGIVGRSYKNCTISGCKNSAEVTGDTSVGGICGAGEYEKSTSKITVTDCENSGKVRGCIQVGGVCGFLSQGTITRCVNTGEITSKESTNGGICGSTSGSGNSYTVTISQSYNTGSVVSYSGYNTGGICGYFLFSGTGSIEHCYNSASVSGRLNVAGICGNAVGSAGKITNCYYLEGNSATGEGAADSSVVAKTAEQFASGEVAYLLNGSASTGTLVWYQNIDAGTRDESPKFTGGTVYKVYEGSPCPGYTNNEDYTTTPRNHNIVSHTCTVCGYRDQYPITVSGITAVNKTYDGNTTAELDVSNMVLAGKQDAYPNVSITATGTFDNANVGTDKTVTITLDLTGDNAEKYYLAESGQQTEATASITAKDITVTITPPSGTYGNVTAATANLNNVVSSDNVSVTLTYSGTANDNTSYSGTTAPTKAGNYTVTASINNSNYKLTGTTTATFEIGKATVPTPTIPSKKYTGQTLNADVPASDLYSVTKNEGGTEVNDDGYPVELALTDDKNYQWDAQGGKTTFQIEKAANEWTGDPAITGWTYGENASNPTMGSAKFGAVQVTYLKDETVLDAVPTNAGSYTARFTVDETTNYAGLTKDVSFTISPKPVTVSGITAKDKTYDGNTTATLNYDGVTFTDKLDGDSLTVSGTGTFTDANVGSDKTVNITALTLGGDSEDNYKLADSGQQTEATASITAKPLSDSDITVTVSDLTYTGNQQSPTVVVTYGEITLAGGTDYELTGNTGTDAGSYTLKVVLKGNYSGSKDQGWDIAKAPITPVVTIADTVYGETLNPSITSGNPGNGEVTYTYYSDAACENPVTPKNVGTYYVKAAVAKTTNYQQATTDAKSFQITKAPLTIKAKDKAITYGDAPANDGVTYEGFVDEETVAVLVGTLAYDYSYSQFDDVGTGEFKITPSGLTSGNYAITFADGTLTVNQKEIGIDWSNTSLAYNKAEQAPTATATGLVNNDECTITVTGQKTDVGNYTATAVSLSNGNYKLPTEVTQAFDIYAVAPTATLEDAKSVYTGSEVSLLTVTAIDGGTVHYSLDKTDWSMEIPKAIQCGEHTVYYYIDGDSNHTDIGSPEAPESITANILPFTASTPTASDPDINYGSNTTLTFNATTVLKGEVSYQWFEVTKDKNNADVYTPLPGETGDSMTLIPNAGDHTYICVATCDGYSQDSAPVTVEVTAGTITPGTDVDLSGLWLEGGEAPADTNQSSIDKKSPSSGFLTSYSEVAGTDESKGYPTGMEVYKLVEKDGQLVPDRVEIFTNLLKYEGCSIRITGKPGIRMITSIDEKLKKELIQNGYEDYTLEAYGTVAQWSKNPGGQPLTLSTGNPGVAYDASSGKDPIFGRSGGRVQYTNVLVWNELAADKYNEDIVMRPFIKLRKGTQELVIYGGTVSRSIGYVAQQNADTFPVGSAGYKYVHDIIDRVANLNPSNESTTTAGG